METLHVVNEDGTEIFDTPVNPLFEKYPRCSSWGYKCIYCGECPSGDHFDIAKLPEEDQQVYKKWLQECREYNKKHNPKLYECLFGEEK